jgi:hypothetical protein
MKLTKENVCVFIENEAQLEEARKMLDKYGESITKDGTFEISKETHYNYLRIWTLSDEWYCSLKDVRTQITMQQLEEILKQSK